MERIYIMANRIEDGTEFHWSDRAFETVQYEPDCFESAEEAIKEAQLIDPSNFEGFESGGYRIMVVHGNDTDEIEIYPYEKVVKVD